MASWKEVYSIFDDAFRNTLNSNFETLTKEIEAAQQRISQEIVEGSSIDEVEDARDGEDKLNDRLRRDFGSLRANLNDLSVSQINKNKGKFDESYLSKELLQKITGQTDIGSVPADRSLTTRQMADKAITPTKTNFVSLGKNKFDGQYHANRVTNSPAVFSEGIDGKSAIVQVNPGQTYTVSRSVDTDVFRIATFASYPRIGDESLSAWGGSHTSEVSSETLTTETNAEYMVVYVSSDDEGIEPEFLQVEEGTEATSPSSKVRIELEDRSVPADAVDLPNLSLSHKNADFVAKSKKNLATNEFDAYALGNDPMEYFSLSNTYSTVVEVEKEKTYTISKASNTDRFVIATSVGHPSDGEEVERVINENNNLQSKTVTMEGEEDHLIIYLSSQGNSQPPDWLQVEEGQGITPYEPPYQLSDDLFGKKEKPPYIITNDPGGNYASTSAIRSIDDLNNDVHILYSFYDELMNAYPDYITRTKLGEDETEGLPIYHYEFKPPEPIFNNGIQHADHPQVIYISSTHGQEKESVLGGLRFFTELANNWKNDEVLQMLRWNVRFSVIPSLNPYGFNNHSRTNGNGVDIGRNQPHNFEYDTAEGSRYAGPSPASEVESQILDTFIRDNTDAILAIDHHTYNDYPDNTSHITWLGCIDDRVGQIFRGLSQHLTGVLTKQYPHLENSNDSLVSIKNTDVYGYQGLVSQHIQDLGVPCILIENAPSFGGDQDDLREYVTDVAGNVMLAGVRYGNSFK